MALMRINGVWQRESHGAGSPGLREYNAKATSLGGHGGNFNVSLRLCGLQAFGSVRGLEKKNPRPGRQDRGLYSSEIRNWVA